MGIAGKYGLPGFPGRSDSKEPACNAGDLGSFLPFLNGNPLQYSCLENLIDRVAWWATIRLTKSRTQLSVTYIHTHEFLNPPPLQLGFRNKFPWARWEEKDHPCQQVRDRLLAEGGLDWRASPIWRGAAAADSRAGEPQRQRSQVPGWLWGPERTRRARALCHNLCPEILIFP